MNAVVLLVVLLNLDLVDVWHHSLHLSTHGLLQVVVVLLLLDLRLVNLGESVHLCAPLRRHVQRILSLSRYLRVALFLAVSLTLNLRLESG